MFFKVFLTHYNSFVPELSNWSCAGLSVVDQKGLSWVSGLRILTQYCSGYWLNIIEDDEDIDSIFLRIVLEKLNFLRILKILRRLGMCKVYLKKKSFPHTPLDGFAILKHKTMKFDHLNSKGKQCNVNGHVVRWFHIHNASKGSCRKKIPFFLRDLSQICLPTHPSQGFCEIWENERWSLGRKRFWGVWTLFGNQPPHPPTFGEDLSKKCFFTPSLTSYEYKLIERSH